MKKRLTAILACALMLLFVCAGMLSTPAHADGAIKYNTYTSDMPGMGNSVVYTAVYNVNGDTVHSGRTGDLTYYFNERTGTLVLLGSGAMSGEYKSSTDTPWSGAGVLRNVIIGEGVRSISSAAFSSVGTIETLSIPSTLETIPDNAFSKCNNLTTLYIPDGVQYIGKSAFYGCTSLRKVYFPKSVSNIGANAFAECNSIYEMFYSGTQQQWSGSINISTPNDVLTRADIRFDAEHSHIFNENGEGIVLCKECSHAAEGWENEFEKRMTGELDNSSLSAPEIDFSLFFLPNSESGITTPFVIMCFVVAFAGIIISMITKGR